VTGSVQQGRPRDKRQPGMGPGRGGPAWRTGTA